MQLLVRLNAQDNIIEEKNQKRKMNKEIFTQKIEIENEINNELDLNLFKKRSSAKTPKGTILGYIKKLSNSPSENFTKKEILLVFQELYRKIDSLENISKINLKGWQGKSSLEIFKKPDCFIVKVFQRLDKNSPPKSIEYILPKKEVNLVWNAIWIASEKAIEDSQSTISEISIPTKDIAREYCILANFSINTHGRELFDERGFNFDNFQSDRATLIPFNKILNLLDYYGLIEYCGGYTRILKKKADIHLILK